MARSFTRNSHCLGHHASHKNNPSACRRNSTASLHRPAHLGSEVVLPTRVATKLDYSAGECGAFDERAEAVSKVLGCADSTSCGKEGKERGREEDECVE